jgi:hypothetical protein
VDNADAHRRLIQAATIASQIGQDTAGKIGRWHS